VYLLAMTRRCEDSAAVVRCCEWPAIAQATGFPETTGFVGRWRELAGVRKNLASARPVSLVGAAEVGTGRSGGDSEVRAES
jgi:hypothetical protein